METTIEILGAPQQIRTGQAIVVRVHGSEKIPPITVHPLVKSNRLLAFQVPLDRLDENSWQGEFSVATAGSYQIESLKSTHSFEVVEQQFMPFQKEFGIFSLVTLLLIGGMLLWLKKRKKLRVGST